MEYYTVTRTMLLQDNRLDKIVQYETLPFENAVVENVTIIIRKTTLSPYPVEIYMDNLSQRYLVARKSCDQFLANRDCTINVNSNALVEKISSNQNKPLAVFCDVNQAIALRGDKNLSIRNSNALGKFYKLLDGRNISRYSINWGGVFLDYNLNRIHSCKRKDIFQSAEKLFFRRVSENLIFAYDDNQYFALNTLVVVNLKKSSPLPLKYLLALLNSRIMNYVYRRKFKSTKTVFSEIQARTVSQLPISQPKLSIQLDLVRRVENILSVKKHAPSADTTELEREIDQVVYRIYGLTADEIKIVEEGF